MSKLSFQITVGQLCYEYAVNPDDYGITNLDEKVEIYRSEGTWHISDANGNFHDDEWAPSTTKQAHELYNSDYSAEDRRRQLEHMKGGTNG